MQNFDPTQLNSVLVKNFVRKPSVSARIAVVKNGHDAGGRQKYMLRTNIDGVVRRHAISNPFEAARLYHKNMATAIAKGYEPLG